MPASIGVCTVVKVAGVATPSDRVSTGSRPMGRNGSYSSDGSHVFRGDADGENCGILVSDMLISGSLLLHASARTVVGEELAGENNDGGKLRGG